MTTVVNLKKEPYDVRIDRQSIFGNPYVMGRESGREAVVGKYYVYAYERCRKDRAFRRAVLALEGKRLGCHCAPLRCHGDILVRLIEMIKEGHFA